ncbi:unnamed protein product [Trichogramma brassicae]|uniref:Uncharacterized protein n=1 Tax=Trichogramma brassicae TaxID=86971 RepID=A0A6H5INA9_9HYME|nr:unnamed protein product [Trichogramma brassicae]
MKPIPGETVMSIIYEPATTGHLVETSKFLGREIDVWTEDRLIIINGGCEHRNWRNRPPVLGVAHKKIGGSGKGTGGHFTLTDGTEPRNPDAGRQPNNCAFDVVSDQTGYPATALRRLVAQRMLIRLYRSRLRGRGHRLQCSRCTSIRTRRSAFSLLSSASPKTDFH